jgi:hypothetical protein
MTIWDAGKEGGYNQGKITTDTSEAFPFLDMEFYWDDNNELNYRVHLKENQVLKYLNRGSNHPKACFKAIYTGVSKRLAKLTKVTAESADKKLDELYPKHAEALEAANLKPNNYPTLKETVEWNEDTEKDSNQKKKRKDQYKRQTFFPAACHYNFDKPIIATLMEARNKHNIKYVRLSMAYHKFPNMTELFQSDLNKKVMHGVISLDFAKRKCNCTKALKDSNNQCIFSGNCRTTTVIYRVTCLTCKENGHPMYYIGSTQNFVKKRCAEQHADDVCRLVNQGVQSDSFANHFADHITQDKGVKRKDVRKHMSVDILWKGNPITTMKTYGTNHCALCMKERMAILEQWKKDKSKLINSKSEIYGACRHRTRFHRLIRNIPPSTDDG